jgi:hypothetical protein
MIDRAIGCIRRAHIEAFAIVWFVTSAGALSARAIEMTPPRAVSSEELIIVSDQKTTTTNAAEMAAAAKLTTKVLAIGSWTAKATPETRPAIMPSEARDTMRLMLAGKIDQWFAKTDGSGAVFLMNVTDTAEAHELLEDLPLGRADMMRFELIPVGPLWPLGLLHE